MSGGGRERAPASRGGARKLAAGASLRRPERAECVCRRATVALASRVALGSASNLRPADRTSAGRAKWLLAWRAYTTAVRNNKRGRAAREPRPDGRRRARPAITSPARRGTWRADKCAGPRASRAHLLHCAREKRGASWPCCCPSTGCPAGGAPLCWAQARESESDHVARRRRAPNLFFAAPPSVEWNSCAGGGGAQAVGSMLCAEPTAPSVCPLPTNSADSARRCVCARACLCSRRLGRSARPRRLDGGSGKRAKVRVGERARARPLLFVVAARRRHVSARTRRANWQDALANECH